MRKLSDLMKELGFNESASTGAQEAFLKNLIREAYGVEVTTPTERRFARQTADDKAKRGEQLSFQLNDLVPIDEISVPKKRRA